MVDLNKEPSESSNDDDWAAYDVTQVGPIPQPDLPAAHMDGPPAYAPTPDSQTPPYAQPPMYQQPVGMYQPQMPYGGYGMMQGPPPPTSQASAIVSLVISSLMVFGCYTTLIGLAPFVFSILSLSKGNNVATIWMSGQHDLARLNADEAQKWARWAWISMAIGVGVVILAIIIGVAVMVALDT